MEREEEEQGKECGRAGTQRDFGIGRSPPANYRCFCYCTRGVRDYIGGITNLLFVFVRSGAGAKTTHIVVLLVTHRVALQSFWYAFLDC